MRKGIELSINLIVVFVISIVILFFGIKFVYDIMQASEDVLGPLTGEIMRELENLAFSQEKKIAIAFNSETLRPGERHLFGLGVRNIDATKQYFAIGVEPGPAYDKDKEIIENNNLQFLYDKKATIALDELKALRIQVKVPPGTKPGSYVVNVYVCNSDSEMGEYEGACGEGSVGNFYDKENPVRKIYVEVP